MTVKKLTRIETLFLIEHARKMYEDGKPYLYPSNDEVSTRDLIRFLVPILQNQDNKSPLSQPSAWERLKQIREFGDVNVSERSYKDSQNIEILELSHQGRELLKSNINYLESEYPRTLRKFNSKVDTTITRP